MNLDADNKYRSEAIAALDNSLKGYTWDSYIKKKKLLAMYLDSKTLLRNGTDAKKLKASAESVFETTIKIARCLCIEAEDAKQTSIRGRTVRLDAEPLYASAEIEYKKMKRLAD